MRELKPWTVYGIKVVTYDDLLPLLREARYFAKLCHIAHHAEPVRAQAKTFLDSLDQIDATKGGWRDDASNVGG